MHAPALPEGVGIVDRETLKSLSGMELLRGWRDGLLPTAPIAHTLGFRLAEIEQGRALFVGTPHLALYNPIGSVHGGYAATLLDSCMSCAIHSTLPAGSGYTTAEIKVNFVRAITVDSGELRAEGRIIHPGRRLATSEGRITDAAGRLLAHGTATCYIFEM
ncbi:MAG: PaaI family thioesterase [Tistlia sp.]|uniref:PaaI family thioesterase n=1 Tax=Tistlia sp. TaxID=3057121 RepID=UPI0034A279EC